jgi:hypothetical protein
MELAWAVLCRSSSIDRDSNILSLLNVVDGIDFSPSDDDTPDENIPSLPIEVTAVSLWWRSDLNTEESGYQRVLVKKPDGSFFDLPSHEIKINLAGNSRRFRSRVHFGALPYAGTGLYQFIIQYRSQETNDEWQDAGSVPLEIVRHSSASLENPDNPDSRNTE